MQDIPSAFDLLRGTVRNQEELSVLHLGLVLHDTVLRNADAVESRAEGSDPPRQDCAFERTDDPHDERPRHEHLTNARHPEKRGAEDPQRPPQRPPQKAPCLPQYAMRSPVV